MEIGLFMLGALGALLTVYLAKEEVIPEFRPLFDSSDKEAEARDHREHLRRTEQEIDDLQAKLQKDALDPELQARLTTVLTTSLSEMNSERLRLQSLEREIKQSQILSRSLGFVFYIVLGGAFGALLAEHIQVDGFNGILPNYFKSVVIGATWTTYLSAIGFRSGQKKADARIEAVQNESAEQIKAAKKEIAETVAHEASKMDASGRASRPVLADVLSRIVIDKLDTTQYKIQKDLDFTRHMIQRDARGFL